MESFKNKSVGEVVSWLKAEGYTQKVCDIFQENEVDGESFLLLSEVDIKELVKPIGPRLKHSKTIDALKHSDGGTLLMKCNKSVQDESLVDTQLNSTHNGLEDSEVVISCDNSFDDFMNDEFSHGGVDSLSFNDDDDLGQQTSCDRHDGDTVDDDGHEEIDGLHDIADKQQPATEPPTKKRKRIQMIKESEPPLPRPFKLPNNFPVAVTLGLNSKKLTGLARPRFFSTIASAIVFHKKYPTNEEYLHVAMEISKQFPFIVNVAEDGYTSITDSLRERVKYMRNYMSGSRSSRNTGSPDSVILHSKSCGKMKATPRQPVLIATDNEVLPDKSAVLRHINMLQKEEKKVRPNMHIVSELMIKTFHWRRKAILSEDAPKVSDILKEYPSFRHHDQIIQEFNRIMNNDIAVVFNEKWKILETKLLTLVDEKKHLSTVQSLLQIAGNNLSDESKCLLAMCCLPYFVPDTRSTPDHELMIKFVSENVGQDDYKAEIVQPSIIIRGTLSNPKEAFLMVEDVVLTSKMPITTSLLSLMATFYVFNIHYPHRLVNAYTLLECYFLNHKVPKGKNKVRDFLMEHMIN